MAQSFGRVDVTEQKCVCVCVRVHVRALVATLNSLLPYLGLALKHTQINWSLEVA